jgi:tetratricopeptide (TPR) repeat protein
MSKVQSVLLILCLALAKTCSASTDQWVQVSSSHFTVITDDGEKQGRHILDQFERMRWVFHTMFPSMNTDPSNPLIVFAAKNRKTFETFEPAAYLAKGQIKLAGLFLRTEDRNYVLLRLDSEQEQHPFATVYHEYTHLQLAGAAEWLPLWLNEGLAQFFQNTDIHDKDVHLGEPDDGDLYLLRQNKLIPLPVLFKVDASSPYYHEAEKGNIFYAESWALTHMLEITDQQNKTQRLHDYAMLLANHEDPVTAAQKSFGDLRKLQSALDSYVGSGSYREFILNSAAASIDEKSYTSKVLAAADADAARADVLVSVGRNQDARNLLDSVLKADPDNVAARETMGMLAVRDHDIPEARKWYSEAVKLDSHSYLAHYYFAQISMMQHGSDEDDAIESSLKQAIQLNPAFAPAYNELAMFYGMRHRNLDEANQLIVKAVKLDPSQLVYRMNGANLLMMSGNYDSARKVLTICMKLAKSPSQEAMVQSRLDQIQQMQSTMSQRSPVVSVDTDADHSPKVIDVVKDEPPAPKHPTEPPTGTKHFAEGIVRGASCSYPSTLEFRVEGAGKAISLYANDYFKISLSAVGFTPEGSMNPCSDFEGKKVRVQYAEVSDKTIDGQVIAIELHK